MIAGDGILTASRRQYHNNPRPSDLSPLSLPKDYFIHSMWSQNIEKEMSYPICSVVAVFKMRLSVLNTATTEQMGYDIVSFFRLFPLNK